MKALIQTGSSLSACGHAQAGGRVPVPLKSDFLSITADRLDEHHSNRAECLRRAGIDVRLSLPTVPLHMKTVVVDLCKVIVGSHNWSEGALSGKRVYESSALIILDAQEPKLADFLLSRKIISDMRSRDLWRQEITTLRHLTQSRGSARTDLLDQLEEGE